jgi:hypothetical protein
MGLFRILKACEPLREAGALFSDLFFLASFLLLIALSRRIGMGKEGKRTMRSQPTMLMMLELLSPVFSD